MSTDVTPERVLQTGFRFLESKALLTAVELGVFTELADGPRSREALEARLDLHPDVSADFLDTLVASGFLEREDGQYRNAPDADVYLDRRKDSYVGDALAWGNDRLYPAWRDLGHALHRGEFEFAADDADDYFASLYDDPERVERYASAMSGFSFGIATVVAEFFEWAEYDSVCDLGAAEGLVPVRVAETHPHVEATAFDLPRLEPVATEFVAERGVADRVSFHGGDFFEDPLPEHDVFVLGRVLHHFEDEAKRTLLERVYDALPDGGAVLVYGSMIDDDRRGNMMAMLVNLNTSLERETRYEYTPGDCERLLEGVGFAESTVYDVPLPETLVVGRKEGA